MLEMVEAAEAAPKDIVEAAAGLLFGETTHEERPDLVEVWVNR